MDPRIKRWGCGLLIALALLAGIRIIRHLWGPTAKQLRFSSLANEQAVAYTLGKFIRETVPGNGDVLLIQLPPASDAGVAAGKYRLKALTKGLGSTRSKVVSVSPKQVTARDHRALMADSSIGAWGETFFQWVEGRSNVRAIVSFMGLPGDLPAEKFQSLPPLLVFGSTGGVPVDDWFAERHVIAWVVPRGVTAAPKGASLEERFGAMFELRRPATGIATTQTYNVGR